MYLARVTYMNILVAVTKITCMKKDVALSLPVCIIAKQLEDFDLVVYLNLKVLCS